MLRINSVTSNLTTICNPEPCPELNEGACERSRISHGACTEQRRSIRNDKKKSIHNDTGGSEKPVAS